MTLKHVLKCFSKIEVQEDKTHPCPPLKREGELSYYNNAECYPLPLREREELLCEQSELSNSGEGCKDLPSPVAFATQSPKCRKTRHFDKMLKQVQHDNFSCAERTVKDLSSNRLSVLTTLKKAAFTLAEVLITLGIIGVVAALTISNVIQDYQKKQTVVQLRKVYNDINNAVKLSEVDNGPMSQWDYVQTDCYVYECIAPFLEKYYLPYFKSAKLLKKSELPNYTRSLTAFPYLPYIRLNNGVLLQCFSNIRAGYIWLFADINGEKGPNIVGRDIFVFDAYKYAAYTHKIRFWNTVYQNKDALTSTSSGYSCRKDNNHHHSNFNCGRLIELNDWEIPKDYPW